VRILFSLLLLGVALQWLPCAHAQVVPEKVWTRVDMRRLFNPYVGQWEGEWIISDVDGEVVKRIQLQQQYWWEKGHLKGVMIYQDLKRVARLSSDIYLENGKIVSEVGNEEDRSYYRAHPGPS